MVFTINFPPNHTDEEEALLKKYAKLRKKLQKKEGQTQKTSKPEPQKPSFETTKRTASDAGVEDAKEHAKKLLKSGAIKLDDPRDKQSFKRSKNFEKKLKDPTEKAVFAFQPFSSQYEDDDDDSKLKNRPFEKNEKDGRAFKRDRPYREPPPKRGHTIYVRAQGITEETARKLFSKHGTIVNISMEADNDCGFITYESMDSSDHAIKHLNDSRISDLFSPLQVSIARRQPMVDTTSDQPTDNSWSSIAASSTTKGGLTHDDQRSLVTYDDDIF